MGIKNANISISIVAAFFLAGFIIIMQDYLGISIALLLIIAVVAASPYSGIIVLIILSPFQPYIRECIGDSSIRFWRELLLLLIFISSIINVLLKQRQLNWFSKLKRPNAALLSVIFFVSYMVLRSALGPHELKTLSGLAENCLYSLFFVVCLFALINMKQVYGIFIAIIISAFIMALGGIWESILGREYLIDAHNIIDRDIYPRSGSFMESPLELGNYLALSIPLIFALIQIFKNCFLRILLSIVAVIIVIALGTTGSRAPWLQFLLSIYIYMVLHPDFSIKRRIKITLLTSAVVVLFVISISLTFPIVGERFLSITDWQKDRGNIARVQRWKTALNHISDAPILGKGLGSQSQLRGKQNIDSDLIEMGALVQESLILKIWLQSGIIGLIFFCYLFFSALKCAYRSRISSYYQVRYIGHAVMCCLVGLIVEIAITQTLHSWAINILFWSFIAISILLNEKKVEVIFERRTI